MFKITENPRVTVKVPLTINGEDASFTATFNILPADRVRSDKLGSDEEQSALLLDAIADLGDLAGADGAPLAFNEGVCRAVIDRFDARTALIAAYLEAVAGIVRGNSPGLLARGPRAA